MFTCDSIALIKILDALTYFFMLCLSNKVYFFMDPQIIWMTWYIKVTLSLKSVFFPINLKNKVFNIPEGLSIFLSRPLRLPVQAEFLIRKNRHCRQIGKRNEFFAHNKQYLSLLQGRVK